MHDVHDEDSNVLDGSVLLILDNVWCELTQRDDPRDRKLVNDSCPIG